MEVHHNGNQSTKTRGRRYVPFPIVHLGGQCQLYVLLFECYSDRSEWKQGLAAVSDSLRCVPPDFQVNTQNPPLYRTLYNGVLSAEGQDIRWYARRRSLLSNTLPLVD